MTNEPLLKQIQKWTNTVPLVVLGSGASVPYNLPSMWVLGNHLINTIHFSEDINKDSFEDFKRKFDETNDLERALTEANPNAEVVSKIVNATWSFINEADLTAYDYIICSTNDVPLSRLIKHYLNTANSKLSIITTNYDRIAEYASSLAKAFIYNGYTQNHIGYFSEKIRNNQLNKLRGFDGQVNILKVHGSLDWFKTTNDDNVQLPLRRCIPDGFSPSIVTPGNSKYLHTHSEPYRTIFTMADEEIKAAEGYLCIGYGFNDVHVQPNLIDQIRNGKPIIVITKKLTDQTKQAIIDNNCKNYVLVEQEGESATRFISSYYGEYIEDNSSYWELSEFLTLI